jgi:hypothetical protein
MMQLFILFSILLLFIITSVLYDILVELEKSWLVGLWCLTPFFHLNENYSRVMIFDVSLLTHI